MWQHDGNWELSRDMSRSLSRVSSLLITCFMSAKNTLSERLVPAGSGDICRCEWVSPGVSCLWTLRRICIVFTTLNHISLSAKRSESSQKPNEIFSGRPISQWECCMQHCSGLAGAGPGIVWRRMDGISPWHGPLQRPLMTCSKCTMCQKTE